MNIGAGTEVSTCIVGKLTVIGPKYPSQWLVVNSATNVFELKTKTATPWVKSQWAGQLTVMGYFRLPAALNFRPNSKFVRTR